MTPKSGCWRKYKKVHARIPCSCSPKIEAGYSTKFWRSPEPRICNFCQFFCIDLYVGTLNFTDSIASRNIHNTYIICLKGSDYAKRCYVTLGRPALNRMDLAYTMQQRLHYKAKPRFLRICIEST